MAACCWAWRPICSISSPRPMSGCRWPDLLEGMAIVHIYTAAPAFLMGTSEGQRRATAMTIWATYMPVGTAVGLLLAGHFAGTAQWRTPSLCTARCTLPWALINLRAAAAAGLAVAGCAHWPQRLLDLRGAYSRPALLLLALAFFLMISLGFGANTTFPGYFARLHELPMSTHRQRHRTGHVADGSWVAGRRRAAGAPGCGSRSVFTGWACLAPLVGIAGVPVRTWRARCVWSSWSPLVRGVRRGARRADGDAAAVLPNRSGAARPRRCMNQAGATATFVNPPLWLPLAAAGARAAIRGS